MLVSQRAECTTFGDQLPNSGQTRGASTKANVRIIIDARGESIGVALPFRKFFTISVTKMSAKRFASQKPGFREKF